MNEFDTYQADKNPVFPLDEARRCGASAGAIWVQQAWRIYKAGWLEFLLAFIILVVIQFGVKLVPFGGLLDFFVKPFLLAGMLQMAHKVWMGEEPELGDFFCFFHPGERLPKMLALGAVGIIYMLAVVMVLGTVILAQVVHAVGLDQLSTLSQQIQQLQAMSDQQQVQMLWQFLQPTWWIFLGVIAVMLLAVFYGCAIWLAVPLVWFANKDVMDALTQSLKACKRNASALLVFGLLAFLLFVLGAIPFLLGELIVMPVLMIATYCACQHIYGSNPDSFITI